jgi:hypothetical protein
MPHPRSGLALLASLALVIGSAAGSSAAPKPKPPPEPTGGTLVALGDSFSAGTGTFDRDDLDCYRSSYAYPVLVAQRTGATLEFRACEGATTADVLANQVGAMPLGTTRVTMTIGGNDVGFADVLSECALPSWLSDCNGAIADGYVTLNGPLAEALDSVYGAIKAAAPDTATITVAGYPHLFNEVSDCSLVTYFDRSEMAKLNDATDDLDALIAARTQATGVGYLDPRAAFDNHAVCDSSPYINGYSSPVGESYHPNRTGNVAYADLFAPAGGGGGGKGGPKSTSSTMSIEEQAEYVADLGLDSPESLARAESAGLEAREIRGLVGQLRSGNENAQLAALKRLEVLDEQVASRRG